MDVKTLKPVGQIHLPGMVRMLYMDIETGRLYEDKSSVLDDMQKARDLMVSWYEKDGEHYIIGRDADWGTKVIKVWVEVTPKMVLGWTRKLQNSFDAVMMKAEVMMEKGV